MRRSRLRGWQWRTGALALACAAVTPLPADPLKQATFTQVVNQVRVVSPSQQTLAAQVGAVFRAPDAVQTGPASRAELKAADNTLTRVGANTVFRWGNEPRTIFLDQGNVLFYSPSGKGGGTIKTAAASAGVLGSTFIVSATRNGGFKVLALQHRTRVHIGGRTRVLDPGQLSFILPGQRGTPAVFEFRLANQVRGSELIRGFGSVLPSMPAILENVDRQEKEIAQGSKKATNLLIGEAGDEGIELFDSNARQAFFDEVVLEEEIRVSDIDRLADASQSDLFITEPDIPEEFVFLPDQTDILAELNAFAAEQGLSAPDELTVLDLGLVVARNIFVQTGTVDLSVFSGRQAAVFLGLEGIHFERSTAFVNYEGGIIFAAESLQFTPGIGLRFERSSALRAGVEFFSVQGMELQGIEIAAPGRALILLTSTGDLRFTEGALGAGEIELVSTLAGDVLIRGSRLASSGAIRVDAAGDTKIGNSMLAAESGLMIGGQNVFLDDIQAATRGDLDLQAWTGNIQVETAATFLVAPNSILTMRAPAGHIHWKANTTIRAGTLNLLANNGIYLDGLNVSTSFIDAAQINLAARTIVLANINFAAGSQVFLRSQNGMLAPNPNTNANPLPGYVNFKENVKYGGNPAQSQVPYSQGGMGPPNGNIQLGTLGSTAPPPSGS